MHKVFISYHHDNDQVYKNGLIEMGRKFGIFIDRSVDDGDISEYLSDEAIRERIRDEYLRDSTVTILLAGTETKWRKHIDWELYSSMFDGLRNKKSGILVVNLPSTQSTYVYAAHGEEEKRQVHPDIELWESIDSRVRFETEFPYLPDRVIDNLLAPKAHISVVPWEKLDPWKLEFLINVTFERRGECEYDLNRRMRRRNA